MRLIDVDDLGVDRCSRDVVPAAYCAGWNGLLGLIEKAPTVDAVPVVHGQWMKRRNGGTLCSRCGHYTQHKGNVLDMSEAIACPWCGAKMDGGTE